jgi:hypothetical protein
MVSSTDTTIHTLPNSDLRAFDANNSASLDEQEFAQAIQESGYSAQESDLLSRYIMAFDPDKQITQNEIPGITYGAEKLQDAATFFNEVLSQPLAPLLEQQAPAEQAGPAAVSAHPVASTGVTQIAPNTTNVAPVSAPSSPAPTETNNSYPDSPTKVEFTNNKNYDIKLVPTSNHGEPIISEPVIIPANSVTQIDIGQLANSNTWSGNFEIRAADTDERTGALLEFNFNADWGSGGTRNFFDLSYINGVAFNSNEQDFINTKATMPNGLVQGNANGDLNDYLGSHWDELYQDGMMTPLQNGAPLQDMSSSGHNLMADLLLEYRQDTNDGFYLYTGTASAQFADDQFSQSWGENQGMKIAFY